jgi:monoterpene epsilon-lactone hydrolase
MPTAHYPSPKQHREGEWLVTHPLSEHDSVAVAALRSAVAPTKGVFDGIAGRERFDAFMQSVPAPRDATFEAATIGGTPGWWARTPSSHKGAAIMYIHGGWFTWGTAEAFRNVAGHIALSAGTDTFVPDYRLAPEHPFPTAVRDVEACYRGLVEAGSEKIAIVGDSAGGNLALVLLSIAATHARPNSARPVGAVVFSPITDLALTGESYTLRAEADLYFTKAEAAILARNYLGDANPTDSTASPLYAHLTELPPIRVHVGDDEVLLDDSRRYVEKALAAGLDAKLDVWLGMPHGFALNIGMFDASAKALESSGAFLAECLKSTANHRDQSDGQRRL